MDASSLLDVSTELIAETPIKPTQRSPRSLSQDVIKRLRIVTIKQGQADAVNTNNDIYNLTAVFQQRHTGIRFLK